MDILLTLNRNYLSIALIMLFSLWKNNSDEKIRVFVISRDLEMPDFNPLRESGMEFSLIRPSMNLESAITTKRYPEEMYYRLFAFSILPESVDKVLYLDPDIIVRKSLKELYDLDTGTAYVAGCTHVRELLTKINSMRLKTDESKAYLNTGVLLMNLALLRKDFTKEEIVHTIMENRPRLLLPDQDVLVILFRDRIMTIDSFRYNLSDRIYSLCRLEDRNINIESVKKNTAIIHYCGRNKPWREGYHGELGQFFNEYEREAKSFFDGIFSCC